MRLLTPPLPQDRADAAKEARLRGEMVDEGAAFDSNAITPGTEFMAKACLGRALSYTLALSGALSRR